MARRAGFTLVEGMTVIVIVGLMMSMAFPRFSEYRARSAVRSATTRVSSSLASARAAAIQRGVSVEFRISGNTISVVEPAGNTTVVPAIPLDDLFGVTVTASATSIAFDPRGLVMTLAGDVPIVLARSGVRSDTVCVTQYGMVRSSCGGL